jgi:hypothetical protein
MMMMIVGGCWMRDGPLQLKIRGVVVAIPVAIPCCSRWVTAGGRWPVVVVGGKMRVIGRAVGQGGASGLPGPASGSVACRASVLRMWLSGHRLGHQSAWALVGNARVQQDDIGVQFAIDLFQRYSPEFGRPRRAI